MARRRRNRRRGGGLGATLLGAALIVAALAAFGVIGWLVFTESNKPGIDAASLCPEDGPRGHLAILLDTTDPVSATQLQLARNRVGALIEAAPDFTRISFATVRADAGGAVRSLCKPPRDASALTANPRLVAERYETAFLRPVTETLDSLLAVPQADSSPIIETLQRFLAAIPGFTEAGADTRREVILVTDLVQHSEVFSFYRGGDWTSFRASGAVDRLARNLSGAEVRILRLPRPAAPQAAVDDFWVRYLDAQGAARVSPSVLGDL
ncbi:hypothetical protein JANAI62_00660 [Jannaschia pagri]|uniref:VWFA domain-containing protein n=1 Tax=Jannaschia pagri TaxID=2829797 RepID=A0ABQ4NG87_9RHOB|nr:MULTISPECIES: hypothetical protein [unclassified Jannaschia]GIT90452.1 hypothetical protein JANAI61_09100 [Jannaschia sp. AI_61]GIT93443.1 hypothetical protein JANAI62_00660 [Jannaschia sp. AI_62]